MDKTVGIIIGIIIVLLGVGLWYSNKDYESRKKWLSEHCKEIGEVSSDVGIGTGISTNGSISTTTIYIPGKKGYKCDDGKEYWE